MCIHIHCGTDALVVFAPPAALKQSKVKVELKCEGCSKSFKTQNAYEQHLGTNKHKKISDKLAALALEAAASPLTGPPAIEAGVGHLWNVHVSRLVCVFMCLNWHLDVFATAPR